MIEQYVVCYAYIVDDPCDGRNSEGALLKERAAGQLEQLAQSVAGSLQEHRHIQDCMVSLVCDCLAKHVCTCMNVYLFMFENVKTTHFATVRTLYNDLGNNWT